MPVYNFSKLSATSFSLIWHIQESCSVLFSQLSPNFLADFENLKLSSKHRIRQSLAVRISLYYLLKELSLPIFPLYKNQRGRPILKNSNFHISFAHTDYLAVVALSTTFPIGIDIELVRLSLGKIKSRFLTETEVKDANNCLEKLAIYWAGKEALYKRLDTEEIVGFKDIFIEPFDLQDQGKLVSHLNHKKYAMGYQKVVDKALPTHILVYSKS